MVQNRIYGNLYSIKKISIQKNLPCRFSGRAWENFVFISSVLYRFFENEYQKVC